MDREVKIAMLSRHNNPHDVRIFHKEARSLSEAGHEVVILQRLARGQVLEQTREDNGVRFHPVRSKRGSKLFNFLKENKRLAEAVYDEKPDAIHCHDLETLSAGINAKKVLAVPLIFDAHEDYPAMAFQSSYYKGKAWSLAQRMGMPYVDRVVTVNDILASQFRDYDPIILQNYPPLWWGEGIRSNLRQFLAPNNETVIIHHGCLNRARKPEVIMKVAREITHRYDARFYFLGSCFDGVTLPNKGNVRGLGTAPWMQIPDFLLASDIGFCAMNPTPKHRQGIPTRVLECMMFKLPFIANEEFPLVRELVDNVVCGAPTKFEVNALVKTLSELIDNDGFRHHLGLAGRRAIETKYNWENEAKKLVELYEELEADH